jgi:hypothetical protein
MDLSMTDFFSGNGVLESIMPTNTKECILVKEVSIQGVESDGVVKSKVNIDGVVYPCLKNNNLAQIPKWVYNKNVPYRGE